MGLYKDAKMQRTCVWYVESGQEFIQEEKTENVSI